MMATYELTIHTCGFGGEQNDAATGHDWTISRGDEPMFYEGRAQMTLGEARQLTVFLNKVGDCQTEWDTRSAYVPNPRKKKKTVSQ